MAENSAQKPETSNNLLGTYDFESSDLDNVEWRGFGTEEDDEFLINSTPLFNTRQHYSPVDNYSTNTSLDYATLGSQSLDYQAMYEDDALMDSYHIDYSQLHYSYPSLSSYSSEHPSSGKKTWSEVVGYEYAHPPIPPPPDPVSEHIDESEESKEIKPKDKKKEVCKYWLQGNCIYGDRCWYAHTKEPDKQPTHLEYSTECCICQEDVLKAHKRFGLMQNCCHIFCLECIRNWRYSHIGDPNVRRCPLCRATSFYVIPSNIPIFDQETKDKMIEMYKANMSKIPCKYFNGGYGVCPFGESCFYSHKLANGQDYTSRMVMQPDGELRDIGYSHSLGDCIVIKTKQNKKKKKMKHIIKGDNFYVCFKQNYADII